MATKKKKHLSLRVQLPRLQQSAENLHYQKKKKVAFRILEKLNPLWNLKETQYD